MKLFSFCNYVAGLPKIVARALAFCSAIFQNRAGELELAVILLRFCPPKGNPQAKTRDTLRLNSYRFF
jgi:hypothetical protein